MYKENTTPEFGTRPNVPNLALDVPTPAWAEIRADAAEETWDETSEGSTFNAAQFALTPSSDPGADVGVSVMQMYDRSGAAVTAPVVFAHMDLVSLEPDEARQMAAALLRAADGVETARRA